MFLNWASCHFEWALCGNRVLVHLIALSISLPFCFVSKLGFFASTSIVATVVILFTSKPSNKSVNFIMGYQAWNIAFEGVNPTANKLEIMHFGEFYGVICFAIEGIGLLIPIRASMQNVQEFRRVFHTTASSIVVWYFIFGATGALVGLKLKVVSWRPGQRNHSVPLR